MANVLINQSNNTRYAVDELTSENLYSFRGLGHEFSKKIAPYTAYLHIGDSKGLNGEGLQIGEGEIDFIKLGEILKQGCPEASFIPEIWQGHKNNGEGFWIALQKLKGIL